MTRIESARTPFRTVVLVLASALLVPGCGIKGRPLDAPDGTKTRTITAAQIEESGARTVWEALQLNIRNVQFTEDGAGVPMRVRNRGASTILLIEDMIIMMDRVRVLDFRILDEISARQIERIEVLSGLDGTTYYGTNAGDGVILIFTRDPGAPGA